MLFQIFERAFGERVVLLFGTRFLFFGLYAFLQNVHHQPFRVDSKGLFVAEILFFVGVIGKHFKSEFRFVTVFCVNIYQIRENLPAESRKFSAEDFIGVAGRVERNDDARGVGFVRFHRVPTHRRDENELAFFQKIFFVVYRDEHLVFGNVIKFIEVMAFARESESRRKSVIIHDYKVVYREFVFENYRLDVMVLPAAEKFIHIFFHACILQNRRVKVKCNDKIVQKIR